MNSAVGWDEHFREIVIPAWQAFLIAEQRLSSAVERKDEGEIRRASYEALREGGAATLYVHHFADVVFHARPPWLPKGVASEDDVRRWLAEQCTYLRTEQPTRDVGLLWAIANSLKHSVLTRSPEKWEVRSKESVLVLSSGYGLLPFGEGKFGGTEQVLVRADSGTRALDRILQNVVDAWRRAMGIELPAPGAP
jgi:hypothetical protein